MLRRNSGRVIFVSSEAAAKVHPDTIHYGVTKTGQVVVPRGLAEMTKETRVMVNSVLPGPTRSEAIVDYRRTRVSNPNVNAEETEAEYFRYSVPLLSANGWQKIVKLPAESPAFPAHRPRNQRCSTMVRGRNSEGTLVTKVITASHGYEERADRRWPLIWRLLA
jgi:NAD(P)-dependent dehydrogenase (short-subunit alcohol dehydrogenase family)